MQKLLATSAIAMIALSGAAFAQSANDGADANFTVVDGNDSTTIQNVSLLADILNQAQDVQIAMTNAAENLANLDGSINILESANVDEMLAEIAGNVGFGAGVEDIYTWETPDGQVQQGSLADYEAAVANYGAQWSWDADGDGAGTTISTGTYVQYLAALDTYPELATDGSTTSTAGTSDLAPIDLVSVQGGDFVEGLIAGVSRTVDGTTAIDFFDPANTVDALQTSVTNLTTTVIGALNTGVIGQNGADGIAANTLAMANMQLESVAQTTGSLANSAQYFAPGDLQLSNFANNMAEVVDASVNVDQLMANVDTVSTTLIGALNTGDIAADVNQNASNLTQALVGQ
ncbi:hypothetical protein [Roseicyclus sp.]